MSMRRNVVSLLIWISVVAIFMIHIILNRKDSSLLLHQRSITQVKTTILKRTEKEKIKYNDVEDIAEFTVPSVTSRANNTDDKSTFARSTTPKLYDIETTLAISTEAHKRWQEENVSQRQEIERLKTANNRLSDREKQFKNLIRRLAAKLKGKEGDILPRLDTSLPWVFAITPTYTRFTQKADLTRLSQTLQHVTNLHWIVVEDSKFKTNLVSRLLHDSSLSYTHLNVRTSINMQKRKGDRHNKHHRGVNQRNLGLKWLRENIDSKKTPGVVYFMDDDNTYHKKIFDQMRYTRHVSAWPVGLSGGARWQGPVVKNGKVVSFHSNWALTRSFPLDMSAFAVNLDVILKQYPDVNFDQNAKRGYLEPTFLQSITSVKDLEPLANNCTEVLVWHTRTEIPKASIIGEQDLIKAGKPSNPAIEV